MSPREREGPSFSRRAAHIVFGKGPFSLRVVGGAIHHTVITILNVGAGKLTEL